MRGLLFGFGLILALLFSELALRILWNPPYLDPKYKRDDLSWMSENVVLNNYGYRDEDVLVVKKPDTFRVYSLGDSFTYGWYINDSSLAYPNVLEKELNERFGQDKVEVINAANPGFKIKDSVERFEQEGVLFSPDIVTLGINLFDLTSKEFRPQKPKFAILAKLRLYEATLGNLERARISRLTRQELDETFSRDSKQLANFREEIEQLNALVSSTGAQLILVIFPQYDPSNPNAAYTYEEFHTRIQGITSDIKVVDLQDVFQNVSDKTQLVLNPTDEHPTPLAHSIAAEAIMKEFDFTGFFAARKPVISEVKQKTVALNSDLGEVKGIIGFEGEGDNWVYFDRSFELGVQKIILADRRDRRIPFMVDYLKTAQASTHNGWPGAKIEANFPGGTNEINLPDILYGYPIVGVHQVTAFWRKDGSLESRDLELSEVEITKSEGAINIEVLAPQTFDFYRVTFDVSVRQLDIDEGEVVSAFKTQVVSKLNTLVFDKIGSLPTFVANGESVNYVWYDNKVIEFETAAARKFEVEIPVAVQLENAEFKPPTIMYL